MTFEKTRPSTLRLALGATALTLIGSVASADQVILDDLIVDGSLCVGQDCVNGESFGFDTLRLKENNLRIKAQDTSNSASFPTQDWQITFNDSSNGGANKFSIDAIAPVANTPFTIEAGAPSHSLYTDDGGRIGFGTNTPVVELHVKDGDTPTLRLEQDGSSGFTPQTWDVAGNETNFFVRDTTSGSDLVLRLRAGAPANSIFVDTDGDVGMGTASPTAALHVATTDASRTDPLLLLKNTNAGTGFFTMMNLENTGTGGIAFRMTTNGLSIDTNNTAGEYRINFDDGDNQELALDTDGNLVLDGSLTTAGGVTPDYVFAPDYELMPLAEVEKFIIDNRHLPRIPSAGEIAVTGLNMTEMQMALLEKVEELMLHTIAQQKTIDALQERLETLAD